MSCVAEQCLLDGFLEEKRMNSLVWDIFSLLFSNLFTFVYVFVNHISEYMYK